MKVGCIISPLHKTHHNTHLYMVVPTLLAYGGTYAKNADMKIENILPFAFPFGIRGPKIQRRVKVSLELCIQVYMHLSLGQFMEGPTILVMNHI